MSTDLSPAQAANETSNPAADALVASMLERISGTPTSGPLSEVVAKVAEPAPVEEAKVAPAVEETVPVEQVEPETEAGAAEEAAEVTPEPEAKQAPEGEPPTVTPVAKDPERFRFKDEEDRAVAQLAKAKGISLVKAAALYASLNETEEATDTPQVAQPPSSPAVKALEQVVAELEAKLDAAGSSEGLWNADVAGLVKQHAKAVSDLGRAIDKAEAQTENLQSFETQRNGVLAETTKTYPAMADPDSPQYMLAAQLAQKAHDPASPDHEAGQQLDAPRYFADKAAKLLNLPPAKAKAASVETAPAATPGKPKPGPAAGTRGTNPPPAERPIADKVTEARARVLSMIGGGGGESDSDVMVM